MRTEQRLSVVEIAERLALPKSTVFYWVRDLALARPRHAGPLSGTRAMQRRYRVMREQAYEDGRRSFPALCEADPTFRDFVCMYIGEGYKRNRNAVRVGNSDPAVLVLATRWLRRLSNRKLDFSLQHHADQDPRELCEFWAATLGVEPSDIAVHRKSNSGQLGGRSWRSRYGVLAVRTCDTQLRARLQAWMDCLRERWVDSRPIGA